MSKRLLLIDKISGAVAGQQFPYDDSVFKPSDYSSDFIPIVVDSAVNTIISRLGTLVPPHTDMITTGNVFGGNFLVGEQTYQTSLQAVMVNTYAPGGISGTDYDATIASVGASGHVGNRCASFKGSYLDDADTPSGCLSVADYSYGAGETQDYYMFSGFLYMDQNPGPNYDPVVFSKSIGVTNGASGDVFRLEIDNSSPYQAVLRLSTSTYASTGYETSLNASPAGISLNKWHHFAFSYSNAGGSACCTTFWNGSRVEHRTFASALRLKNSDSDYTVGAAPTGYYPFRGYVDDLVVSAGATVYALRGMGHGTTCYIPVEPQRPGRYTLFHLNMDGPLGTSLFPCDVNTKIVAETVSLVSTGETGADSTLYTTGSYSSQNKNVHGLALWGSSDSFEVTVPNGIPTDPSYVFGYESGTCMLVTGVTTAQSYSSLRSSVASLVDHTASVLLGLTMAGYSGSSGGDMPKFRSYITKNAVTFTPTPRNIQDLRTLYEGAASIGDAAAVYIYVFDNGVTMGLTVGGISALNRDVSEYYAKVYQDTTAIKGKVLGSSNRSQLTGIEGFTHSSFIQKLGGSVSSGKPTVLVKGETRVTGKFTNRNSVYG